MGTVAAGGENTGDSEMLSASSVFAEIFRNDQAFQLFCSIAASGEAQGGWENGRIAALVPESYQGLAPKIVRHGADEDKHGRIFRALLRKRGLEPVPVPSDTNYTMLLEGRGIGLAHSRLGQEDRLTERDIITYLAHSRVTEQRAAEQMRLLRRCTSQHPDLARAVRMISNDEDNHLAYCHEELLHLAAAGHAGTIRGILHSTALAEIAIYRDVSMAVMAHLGRILHWPRPKSAALAAGIQAVYGYERLGGWRRMVSLSLPERRNALGGPAPEVAAAAGQGRALGRRWRDQGEPEGVAVGGELAAGFRYPGDDVEDDRAALGVLAHAGRRLRDSTDQRPRPLPDVAAAVRCAVFGRDAEHAVAGRMAVQEPQPGHIGFTQVGDQVGLGFFGDPAWAARQGRQFLNGGGEAAGVGHPGAPLVGIPPLARFGGICHQPSRSPMARRIARFAVVMPSTPSRTSWLKRWPSGARPGSPRQPAPPPARQRSPIADVARNRPTASPQGAARSMSDFVHTQRAGVLRWGTMTA